MLEDIFGRKFYYLRLSITDACNFKCEYCLPDGYDCNQDRDFLTLPEIRRVAQTFAKMGTQKIRLTGGEPSLRKDLPEIISTCKQIEGIKKVVITTNGFKLSSHVKPWIENGLDALNVSIDSLNPRQFQIITGHNKLGEILKGIDRAFSLGFENVKVNTVLMRQHNFKEVDHFMNWIKDTPVTLRFIELMQTGNNNSFFERHHVSGMEIKERLINEGWQLIDRGVDAGPAQEFSHPDYQGKIGLIMPYSKDFCATCNRLRVTALGHLHLCLFADQGHDLRKWLQSDDSIDGLCEHLQSLLMQKEVSHYLHQGITGATKHLAMLGG